MKASAEGTPSQTPLSDSSQGTQISPEQLQHALDANKRLQQILSQRAEALEVELREVDQLLSASSVEDGLDDPESEVYVAGAKKATGLFPPSEFLNPVSPFYEDAAKRSAYIANTSPHPMKAKDIEALADAVKRENERLQAYQQRSGPCAKNETIIDLNNNVEGLDWMRIAERVSDSSSVKRSAAECRVTWVADKHPRINHAKWSDAEVDKLHGLLFEHGKHKEAVNWVEISRKLGTNRTPIDCMRQSLPRHRHFWTLEADQKLIKAVQSCGIDNWMLVARKVSESATAGQCQTRWYKSLDPGLKRGSWTEEEDNRLRKAVAGFGTSWVQVAAAIPGRTNDQCRERWVEQLNPSASKLVWTEEDDKVLIESVKDLGHQWKAVCLRVGNGKTGPNCRMRYEKLQRSLKKQASPIPGPSSAPMSFQSDIPVFSRIPPVALLAQHDEGSFGRYTPSTTPVPTLRPQARAVGKGKNKKTTAVSFTPTIPGDFAKDVECTPLTSALQRSNGAATLQTPENLDGGDGAAAATPYPRPKPRPVPQVKDSVPGQAVAEVAPDLTRKNAEPSACTPADNSMPASQLGSKYAVKTTPPKRGRKRKEDSDEAQYAPSIPTRSSKRLRMTRASKSSLENTNPGDVEDLPGSAPSMIGNSELEADAQASEAVQQLSKRGRKRKLDTDTPVAFVSESNTLGPDEEQAGDQQLVSLPAPLTTEEAPGPDANNVTPAKRKRGRPRKVPAPLSTTPADSLAPAAPVTLSELPDPLTTTGEAVVPVKRGRGRPRKAQQASENT